MITSPHTLAELLEHPLAHLLTRQPIRPLLNLPNLRVNRVNLFANEKGLTVTANIANTGRRESGPFFVMTIITRDGQPEPPLFQRLTTMAPLTSQDVELGIVASVPGQNLCATVVVDPPTDKRPAGEVIESNEEDNIAQACFFVPVSQKDVPDPGDFD